MHPNLAHLESTKQTNKDDPDFTQIRQEAVQIREDSSDMGQKTAKNVTYDVYRYSCGKLQQKKADGMRTSDVHMR